MDPILLMFSIFTLWRLVWESPDQAGRIMQEIKTAISKEQRPQQEIWGERWLAFLLEDGIRRDGRGINFCSDLGDPSFRNVVLPGRHCVKAEGHYTLATEYVDITC